MILKYSINYYIKKLLISILLLIFPLSCYWGEFKLTDTLVKDIKFKGDAYFHYKDYSSFSEELKELAEWRSSLNVDKGREIIKLIEREWGNEYISLFKEKYIYDERTILTAEEISKDLEDHYKSVKKYKEEIQNLHKNDKITYNYFKDGNKNSFRWFYFYIRDIITSTFTVGSAKLKELYRDFDILFIKVALAKITKILIYHFPSLYNDLVYLFEDSDKYFK